MPPFDVTRPPDLVAGLTDQAMVSLAASGEGRFAGGGIELDAMPGDGALSLRLRTNVPLLCMRLRWAEQIPEGLRYLGALWDRSQHTLEWRGLVPERPLPWYFLAHDGQHTHGVGVQTGAAALCHWQIDPYGVTLWLDVRNGGSAVEPGDRELHLADVVVRPGKVWEVPFQSARRFAAQLDRERLLPEQPLYGYCFEDTGDWDPQALLTRARELADLAENTVNRPHVVIGAGWQHEGSAEPGEMEALAAGVADVDCLPGLWLRPLRTVDPEHRELCLRLGHDDEQSAAGVLDPTHPEAVALIQHDVQQAAAWGFRLVCHDRTTWDLLSAGRGPTAGCADEGWRFYDPTLTTAEVFGRLYASLRQAAGERTLVVGRNTIGHLAAGQVHVQDISGRLSERPLVHQYMQGVNALAFRGFQHGALYATATDPVRLSPTIPWAINEQWLSLLASSGTPCFVAPGAEALSDTTQRALRSAFSKTSRQLSLAEPLDWLVTTSPRRWKLGNETVTFDWFSAQYDETA